MRTHRRFRRCHKAFNVVRTKKSFLKNVATKCFMAQTKLPMHVEAQNTKRLGLQLSCMPFQKRFTFVDFKNAFLKQFKVKEGVTVIAL